MTRAGARWAGIPRLGRVLGVPLRLDLSWFAGLAVVVLLSRELWGPELAEPAALLWSVRFAVAFFACVLVRELAHAVVARAIRGCRRPGIRLFVFGGVARITQGAGRRRPASWWPWPGRWPR